MQLTAKLLQLLPVQTGAGKNLQWKKQDIIVETEGRYPKKICISIWGDKINDSQLQIGNNLKIDFGIETRDYNTKWYTDIKAWKIELATTTLKAILLLPKKTIQIWKLMRMIGFLFKLFICAAPLHTCRQHLYSQIKRHEHIQSLQPFKP